MKKRASSFMEYAIVLGVISAVLVGMNTYVKRGMQGRLKEMTDYFISSQQLTEIYSTESTSDSITDTAIDKQAFIGGGTKTVLTEARDVQAQSTAQDKEAPLFVSQEAGKQKEAVTPPVVP